MGDENVYIVDDEEEIRESLSILLEVAGFAVQSFPSAEQFLADHNIKRGCVIVDVRMPDMTGLELQEELIRRHMALPVIVMTGHGDVPIAVQAMKAGATDFLEKPFEHELILASVRRALEAGTRAINGEVEKKDARDKLAALTAREREVLDKLVLGCSNKVAAYELGISPRTVEVHRARIMEKLDASGLSDIVRIALAAR
jgi:two-component system response regulator FixJ